MMEEFERRRKFKTVYESLEENDETAKKEKERLKGVLIKLLPDGKIIFFLNCKFQNLVLDSRI